MSAYYNENDPFAAAWLRKLIAKGFLSPGVVDERDIRDVTARDLTGVTRCHFFAGIGGWDLALGLAGWPEDRPVWTGSCPCQPFSGASGARAGFGDPRHLWPTWLRLIRECRPPVVFGEQVASAEGLNPARGPKPATQSHPTPSAAGSPPAADPAMTMTLEPRMKAEGVHRG